MNEEVEVKCPFCGEFFTVLVDTSVDQQSYIEDCFVCCRPIHFTAYSEDGEFRSVETSRED